MRSRVLLVGLALLVPGTSGGCAVLGEPCHAPVFVLTHHERPPVELEGGSAFVLVTEGFDAAYARAVEAAAGGDVRIAGGAATVRQAFRAEVLDEITLDVAPVLLGAGERPFDGVADPGWCR